MTHDLEAMASAVDGETRLLHLCNPNNPTGTLLDGGAVRAFVAELSPRVPVVVDEAYLELQDDETAHTAIDRVLAGDRVVVLRTFSKLHGMAGLRVGYAVAPPALAGTLRERRVTFMSRPGVTAALASLADTDFQAFSRARIREAMAVTTGAFDALGLAYTPSHGNFVAVDVGEPVAEFSAAMRAEGILTGRPVEGYPTWARISMGKVEDMHRLAEALRNRFERA
jgi:histidinol-phosphate aminotransferase